MDTEVTNLPNFSGFLRFGRNLPVLRFSDTFNEIRTLCAAFIERTDPPKRLPAGKDIITHVRAAAQARAAAQSGAANPPPPEKPRPTNQPDLFEPGNPLPEPAEQPPPASPDPFEPKEGGVLSGGEGSDTPVEASAPVPFLGAARGRMSGLSPNDGKMR
ncbi:hypothetical protein [Sphingobium cloacae]|nr:hypothetical protein [Sphingobium cloacae]